MLLGGTRIDGRPSIAAPDSLLKYASLFDAEIRRVGARTVLLDTWARRSQPEDQQLLDYAYFSVGTRLGSQVAPVGVAWAAVRSSHPELILHNADGSHPSPAGTWLAGAVLSGTICGVAAASLSRRVVVDSIDWSGEVQPDRSSVIDVTGDLGGILEGQARIALKRVKDAGGYLAVPAVLPESWAAIR